jgi:hypothetical protein
MIRQEEPNRTRKTNFQAGFAGGFHFLICEIPFNVIVAFMKFLPSQILFVLIATTSLFAQPPQPSSQIAATKTSRLPVSDWMCMSDKEKKFGPTESSDAIVFSGEGFAEKGRGVAAFFPETTLSEGQSLTVSARVTFTGVHYFGLFKFGIFQSASRTQDLGWVGYCAFAGSDKFFPKGGLFASEAGNKKYFGSQTEKIIAESTTPQRQSKDEHFLFNIKDGEYLVQISLALLTGNKIACKFEMAPESNPDAPIASYDGVDDAPSATAFDALGFAFHQGLSTDSVEFRDVVVEVSPTQK